MKNHILLDTVYLHLSSHNLLLNRFSILFTFNITFFQFIRAGGGNLFRWLRLNCGYPQVMMTWMHKLNFGFCHNWLLYGSWLRIFFCLTSIIKKKISTRLKNKLIHKSAACRTEYKDLCTKIREVCTLAGSNPSCASISRDVDSLQESCCESVVSPDRVVSTRMN